MMSDGNVIYDVSGDEKKSLTVPDLLRKFEEVSGGELANDRHAADLPLQPPRIAGMRLLLCVPSTAETLPYATLHASAPDAGPDVLPGPAFISPAGGAALRVSPHGGPDLPATLARWRRVARRICASRAHATRQAGRSEATARPSPCMETRRVGSRAKSDDEGHRTHRFRVPRTPGNRARLPPTAFFVQLLKSPEYPVIPHPYYQRFSDGAPRVSLTNPLPIRKTVTGYDADARVRGRKPRRRPAIAASGSTQTPQPPADMPSGTGPEGRRAPLRVAFL